MRALILFFNALADGRQSEALGQPDDRPHYHQALGILSEALHKAAVNLDLVKVQRHQLREGGVSGAKIVERYCHARRPPRIAHPIDRGADRL
jgi:hypothetical protein